MSKPHVFLREATGLIREMGTADIFYYNFLTIAIFAFGHRSAFATSGGTFPGSSPGLAYLISMIGVSFMTAAFAMMAVSMPRGAGEYIYQSRVLHPAIGFATTFTVWVMWIGNFGSWGATALVQAAIFPLTLFLGQILNSPELVSFGAWALTPVGLFIVSFLFVLFVYLLCIPGLRTYVRFQYLLFWGTIVASILLILSFALTPTAVFIERFNKFMLIYQSDPDLYHTIISTAKEANVDTNPPFSLTGTFGILPTAYTGTVWGYWSACQQSEVKRASDLKNQLIGMLGATVAACVVLALIGFSFVNTLGYEFWNALGYHVTSGTAIAKIFPALPDYFLLGALVSSAIPIVMAIILIGAIFNFIQILFNCQIPFPRFLMQYSFDRIFPAKLADVSERWHSPVIGYTINLVITTVWLILIVFTPLGGQLFSVMIISCVLLAADMLAAIILPYRKSIKGIWETSPASKYKIAGIPAIVVLGVIGFLFNAWMMWYYAFFPEIYWAASPPMVTLAVAEILFIILLYFAIRAYRRRQGIDIDIAFKSIPPE